MSLFSQSTAAGDFGGGLDIRLSNPARNRHPAGGVHGGVVQQQTVLCCTALRVSCFASESNSFLIPGGCRFLLFLMLVFLYLVGQFERHFLHRMVYFLIRARSGLYGIYSTRFVQQQQQQRPLLTSPYPELETLRAEGGILDILSQEACEHGKQDALEHISSSKTKPVVHPD